MMKLGQVTSCVTGMYYQHLFNSNSLADYGYMAMSLILDGGALTELKGTAGPWQRYALCGMPFWFTSEMLTG